MTPIERYAYLCDLTAFGVFMTIALCGACLCICGLRRLKIKRDAEDRARLMYQPVGSSKEPVLTACRGDDVDSATFGLLLGGVTAICLGLLLASIILPGLVEPEGARAKEAWRRGEKIEQTNGNDER